MIRLEAATATVPAASAHDAPRPILRELNAEFRPGEIHLILGPNGAGKTTLIRLLAGMVRPTSGRVLHFGVPDGPERGRSPLWPRVAVLFEEPDPQFLTDTVEAEVAFGLESIGLPPERIRSRTGEVLESFELAGFERRAPLSLSAGEKVRALLAAAMAGRPKVLLIDQAFAHLDPGHRRAIERRLVTDALSSESTLIRTHQDSDSPHAGERLQILDGARLADATDLSPSSVLEAERVALPLPMRLSALLAGRGMWDGPLAKDSMSLALGLGIGHSCVGAVRWDESPDWGGVALAPPVASPPIHSGDAVLAIQGVDYAAGGGSARAPLLDGISLELRGGEVAALVGVSGSGKSTLLKLAAGLLAPTAGSVRRALPRGSRGRSTGLALEYPERQLFGRTVEEDVEASLWVEGVPLAERRARGRQALDLVGLDPDRFRLRVPLTLSEGEKRRVALASLLADRPSVILLDEPTAGLDPGGRRALVSAVLGLSAGGHAILLASHDLDFVSSVADRVYVLGRERGEPGSTLAAGAPASIFRDPALLRRAALPAPDFLWAEWALRCRGLLGADPVRDADSLLSGLARGLAAGTAAATGSRAALDR